MIIGAVKGISLCSMMHGKHFSAPLLDAKLQEKTANCWNCCADECRKAAEDGGLCPHRRQRDSEKVRRLVFPSVRTPGCTGFAGSCRQPCSWSKQCCMGQLLVEIRVAGTIRNVQEIDWEKVFGVDQIVAWNRLGMVER